MTSGTAPEKPMDIGQYSELVAAVVRAVPRDIPKDVAQGWIINPQALKSTLRSALLPPELGEASVSSDSALLAEWSRFYAEVFGIAWDGNGLVLPAPREGFGWIVVVHESMTRNTVLVKCKERFKKGAWSYYDDLNKEVKENDRDPAELGTYAIRVRDRVEADEELKELSANQIAERKIKGITVLERMLLELWYHWRTRGKHLDVHNVTLCTGSRSLDGDVPGAYLSGGGQFEVSCCPPGGSYADLRCREVAVS